MHGLSLLVCIVCGILVVLLGSMMLYGYWLQYQDSRKLKAHFAATPVRCKPDSLARIRSVPGVSLCNVGKIVKVGYRIAPNAVGEEMWFCVGSGIIVWNGNTGEYDMNCLARIPDNCLEPL